MKQILFLSVYIFCFISVFSQVRENELVDSKNVQEIAYYANNIYVGSLLGLNPELIDSVKIIKEPADVNGSLFMGKFYVFYKQDCDWLSLEDIMATYLKKQVYTPVFYVDGHPLTGDVYTFKFDADYILDVRCVNSDELGYLNKNESKFSIVTISTRTKENIEQKAKIFIR